MKTIEVKWKARPSSGVTEIPLSELGAKNKKHFETLTEVEQRILINKWLSENEERITANAIQWNFPVK